MTQPAFKAQVEGACAAVSRKIITATTPSGEDLVASGVCVGDSWEVDAAKHSARCRCWLQSYGYPLLAAESLFDKCTLKLKL